MLKCKLNFFVVSKIYQKLLKKKQIQQSSKYRNTKIAHSILGFSYFMNNEGHKRGLEKYTWSWSKDYPKNV